MDKCAKCGYCPLCERGGPPTIDAIMTPNGLQVLGGRQQPSQTQPPRAEWFDELKKRMDRIENLLEEDLDNER